MGRCADGQRPPGPPDVLTGTRRQCVALEKPDWAASRPQRPHAAPCAISQEPSRVMSTDQRPTAPAPAREADPNRRRRPGLEAGALSDNQPPVMTRRPSVVASGGTDSDRRRTWALCRLTRLAATSATGATGAPSFLVSWPEPIKSAPRKALWRH